MRQVSDAATGGGAGLEVGKKVSFSEGLGIKFGDYILKKGDKLCSPDQNNDFFSMRWKK